VVSRYRLASCVRTDEVKRAEASHFDGSLEALQPARRAAPVALICRLVAPIC
jgi:hypothetical protein